MEYMTLREHYKKLYECLPVSAIVNGPDYYYILGVKCEEENDYIGAKKKLLFATALGSGEAAMHLGFLYQNGFGTDVNINKALDHYKYAIQLGFDEAYGMIEKMVKDGLISQEDAIVSKRGKKTR